MSDKEAAVLIGRFFPEIKDKLLNTLQLADKIDDYSESELLVATIEQRTAELQPIRFSDAVDFKDNYKHGKGTLYKKDGSVGGSFIFCAKNGLFNERIL